MELIIKKKKELGKTKPFVQWRFLVTKYNENEIEKAKELAKKINVDKLEFSQLRSDMGKELFKGDETKFEETKEWFPKEEKYRKYNFLTKKRKYVPKGCPFLWKQTLINWDGSISPCCSCYDARFDFGNMFESNLKTVWNGEKYRAARKLIGRGKSNKIKTICSNCLTNGFLD